SLFAWGTPGRRALRSSLRGFLRARLRFFPGRLRHVRRGRVLRGAALAGLGLYAGVILRGLEPERCERREVNRSGEGAVLPGLLLGLDASDLKCVAAAVVGRVGVEEESVRASFGEAEAVAVARGRREVADADER